jgi:hypothetical protein
MQSVGSASDEYFYFTISLCRGSLNEVVNKKLYHSLRD